MFQMMEVVWSNEDWNFGNILVHFGAFSYFISQERNNIVFNKNQRTYDYQLFQAIFEMFRLKIMYLRIKTQANVVKDFEMWKIDTKPCDQKSFFFFANLSVGACPFGC